MAAAGYSEGSTRTFVAGGAIGDHLRVILTGGKLAVAGDGATDANNEIGQVERQTFADGDEVAVRLRNAPGTRKCVAASAITVGTAVYGAANGRVDDVVSGAIWGIALTAAGAAGDVFEVLKF